MRAKKQAKKQTKKQTKKQDEEADEEVRRMKKPLLRRRAEHGMAGWRWTNRARKLAETTRRTTRGCERTPGALASSQGQPGHVDAAWRRAAHLGAHMRTSSRQRSDRDPVMAYWSSGSMSRSDQPQRSHVLLEIQFFRVQIAAPRFAR